MDEQRLKRNGKPSHFILIPIHNDSLKQGLLQVKSSLLSHHKNNYFEINKGFTDIDCAHITLLALNGTRNLLDSLIQALKEWVPSDNLVFELEVKGLGSWRTKGDNIVLWADLTKESKSRIISIAQELRAYLFGKLGGHFDDDEGMDYLPGGWIDDPHDDIYLPHLTLLNTDPGWDRKLRDALDEPRKRGKGKGRHEVEDFGMEWALFRDIRREYRKYSFGKQEVSWLELQSDFQCLQKIALKKRAKHVNDEK